MHFVHVAIPVTMPATAIPLMMMVLTVDVVFQILLAVLVASTLEKHPTILGTIN